MDNITTIKLQQWWMNELQKLTDKCLRQEQTRQEKVRQKNETALSDYRSKGEILDAYGCGIITERKKDKLLDLWEETNETTNELHERKINLLWELYNDAKRVLEEAKKG